MPSLTCFTIRFTPSWLMTIITVLSLSILLALGLWQIQRGNEKKHMLYNQQRLLNKQAIPWRSGSDNPQQYQSIKVQGRYDRQILLLDNQHQNHQFGYNVLSPLILTDGTVIIVDRGWIKGEDNRRIVPNITTPEHTLRVEGHVYFPSAKQWVLGQAIEKKQQYMMITELLDTQLFSHVLQKKVHPFIIRLNKDNAYGFIRDWTIVSMPPARHFAYALQWFSMALVVFILFIVLNVKKK